jgi:hypothetical protein
MGGVCARLRGAAIGVVLTCVSASAQSTAQGTAASQPQSDVGQALTQLRDTT